MASMEIERDVIGRLRRLNAIGPEEAERLLSSLSQDCPSPVSVEHTSRPHLFDLSASCLEVSAVGNHAVWAATLSFIARHENLDAYIIPPPARDPQVREIWNKVFDPSRIVLERPPGIASVTAPTPSHKELGLTARNAFEDALWQIGRSLPPGERVDVPVLWRCDPDCRRVMIAPVEYTEGNRYYDAEYWLDRVREIRAAGYEINLCGVQMSDRDADGHGGRLLGRLVATGMIARNYGSTLAELELCIASSCLAVCASTGPTWLCLFSDIPQIMLCAPHVTSPSWRCEANAAVLTKPVMLLYGKAPLAERLPLRRVPTPCFHFDHGLGDVANAARLLQLYRSRGIEPRVSCRSDKEFVFRAAGATIVPQAHDHHPWPQPTVPFDLNLGQDTGQDWAGNKIGGNLNHPLLGDIGARCELWRELCDTDLDITGQVRGDVRNDVRAKLADLPRPLVLLHTTGTTCQAEKSIPREQHVCLYRELLNRMPGSLVLLDWDARVEPLASYRVRGLVDLLGRVGLEELVALISLSDLVVGVDSGPIHLAGLTRVPCVGVFRGPHHHPASYCVPNERRLCVTEGALRGTNLHKRIQFGIVEVGEDDIDVAELAEHCRRMLAPARYLPGGPIAADVQLQQFVQWCDGGDTGMLSRYADRHTSFDILLRESTARFQEPRWVETGCIRSAEDWAGAGYSTYLFGAYLCRVGGRLHSIDVDPNHCRFARERTAVFGAAVEVHEARGDDWLAANRDRIDVLYLDSMDTTLPGHQESCLDEVRAGLDRLHEDSLVLFDDTPFVGGAFVGKGALAVPWMLAHGWRVKYAGYQVLLERRR